MVGALDEKLDILVFALDFHQFEHGDDLVSHDANGWSHTVAWKGLEDISADEFFKSFRI